MHHVEDLYLCEYCFAELNREKDICPVCGFQKDTYEPEAGVLPAGEILAGKYLIGKMLGRGGFGITYLGFDIPGKKKVAIKEYLPDGLAARQPGQTMISVYTGEKENLFKKGADRFFEEAKMVSRFNGNPNIVSVYEFFYENQTAYFVMEYLDGMDLKKYTAKNGGKLPVDEAVKIIIPIMDALTIVHSAGVLHRDISPDNIFLTNDNEVKLIDFGAARQVIGEQSKSLSIVLKQGFAPIEQYQTHGHFGPWSDIYALCATFYFMITGKVPEAAMDRMELDQLMPPSAMGIEIPVSLERILMRGLSYKAADRPQSVIELKAGFMEALPKQEEETGETPVYVNPYSVQDSSKEEPFTEEQKQENKGFLFDKNEDYYQREFSKIREGKRAGFHIPAFFLTFFWMFYRKMFLGGGILLGSLIVFQIIAAGAAGTFAGSDASLIFTVLCCAAGLGVGILCGLMGNSFYYKYYEKVNLQAKVQGEQIYRKKSGVLSGAPMAGVMVGAFVVNGLIAVISSQVLGNMTNSYPASSRAGAGSTGSSVSTTSQGDLHKAVVQDIRNQYYNDEEKGATVGQVFDLYFDNGRWDAEGTDSSNYHVTFQGQAYYANRFRSFQFEFAMEGQEMTCKKIMIGGTEIASDKWSSLLKVIEMYYKGMSAKSVDAALNLMFVNQRVYTTLPEAQYLLRKSGLTYQIKTNRSGERKELSVAGGKATLRFYKTVRTMNTVPYGSYLLIVKDQKADASAFLTYCMGWSTSSATQFYSGTDRYRLSESGLKKKSETELMIMRNEIFARHYRKFEDPLLQAIFLTKNWYRAVYSDSQFKENWNDAEEYNLKLIVKVEEDLGYR